MNAQYECSFAERLAPDSIVRTHADLVKRIAYHLAGKLPRTIEVEDLIQAGMIGLLNAARNYSAAKGANFETYAGIRIRGAMLDEARRANFSPRSTVRNARQISQVVREIENRTGKDARASEVAGALGVSMDEYHSMLESAAASRVLSLDQLMEESERDDLLAGDNESGPLELLAADEFREELSRVIGTLPERERIVLSLYYDEELNLREIGEVLNVTESRVCQIHGQAVVRIRARLKAWLE
jgi:RNA polymerase sigma factor for flagellar operon FliA